MDVVFETSEGREFTAEIWFFATVREIKEAIKKYQGIAIDQQALVFNGQTMEDERNTEYYKVLQGSRIRVNIVPHPSYCGA